MVIVGKSASGKDTLKNIIVDRPNSLEPIVTYTTRPMRDGEIDGYEYNFVSLNEFESLDLYEKRAYVTAQGTWWYGSTIPNINDGDYVVVLDPSGTQALIDAIGRENCFIVSVFACQEIRTHRAMKRGGFDMTEWKRRSLADDKDFMNIDFRYDILIDNNRGDLEDKYSDIMYRFGKKGRD